MIANTVFDLSLTAPTAGSLHHLLQGKFLFTMPLFARCTTRVSVIALYLRVRTIRMPFCFINRPKAVAHHFLRGRIGIAHPTGVKCNLKSGAAWYLYDIGEFGNSGCEIDFQPKVLLRSTELPYFISPVSHLMRRHPGQGQHRYLLHPAKLTRVPVRTQAWIDASSVAFQSAFRKLPVTNPERR